MPTYTITVTNNARAEVPIYVCHAPAEFVGKSEVFCNSLGSFILPTHEDGHMHFETLKVSLDFLGAVQNQTTFPAIGNTNKSKTSTAVVKLRDRWNPDGSDSHTSVSYKNGNPHLENPTKDNTVPSNAFRISTPSFQPGEGPLNAGMAINLNGVDLLSSYVTAESSAVLDIKPSQKIYISRGGWQAGTVVAHPDNDRYTVECDPSDGKFEFHVKCNDDGSLSQI